MAKATSKNSIDKPPSDPMPLRVDPCVAKLVDKPPAGPDWVFEVKWDGYRIAVHIEPDRVRIITRGGYDWTKKFPTIAAEARLLDVKTAIFDGEAVVLDDKGRSDFGMLQDALGRRPASHEPSEVILFAFDLLYLNGRDLRRLSLRERRQLLEPIVAGRQGAIRLSEEVEAAGEEFFRVACEHGLEGIIAKHRARAYHSGRRPEWLKIKCAQRDSFVIVGFDPSSVPGAIGRLLLAARKGESLIYVGGVGTGFSHQMSIELRKLLEGIVAKNPPVRLNRKNSVFTEPLLVAEIEYRSWTNDLKLRHATFKGVRERSDDATVYSFDERT